MAISRPSFEYILISAESSDPYSTRVVHTITGKSVWSYKAFDSNAAASFVEPVGIAGDFLLAGIKGQPLLHLVGLGRNKFHVKSTTAAPVITAITDTTGSFLLAAIGEKIYVWNILNRELLNIVDAHFLHITVMKLSANNGFVVSGATDGSITVHHLTSLVSSRFEQMNDAKAFRTYTAHNSAVTDVAVTLVSDPRILSVSSDNSAAIYSISADAVLLKITDDFPITSCAIDPAESRFFFGLSNGMITVVDNSGNTLKSQESVQFSSGISTFKRLLKKHDCAVTQIAVSFDGSLLATGDSDGHYHIWDIATGSARGTGKFFGPIKTIKFIRKWPSITVTDYSTPSMVNTPFSKMVGDKQLKINVTATPTFNDEIRVYNQSLLNEFLEKEFTARPTKPKKSEDVEVIPTETSNDEKDKRIRELEEENEKLYQVNSELYELAKEQILGVDDACDF